jgi:N-acetylmuramoyl-L-alanine amidase
MRVMAVDFAPGANYVGSPYFSSRGDYSPEAIVLHIMDGTLLGCDSWFNNNPYGVSAHFGINKLGEIHQYVYLSNAAHANGKIENWDLRLIKENGYTNPNDWTISIEHEGMSGDSLTWNMYNASVKLSAWLWQNVIVPGGASGLGIDRDHFLRHGDISPTSRPGCPGWSQEILEQYINDVRRLLARPDAVPAPIIKTYDEGLKEGRIKGIQEARAAIDKL